MSHSLAAAVPELQVLRQDFDAVLIAVRRMKDHFSQAGARSSLHVFSDQSRDLEQFLESCCEPGEDHSVPHPSLRRAYERWCATERKVPVGPHVFYRVMLRQGFYLIRPRRNNRVRTWMGLALLSETVPIKPRRNRRS